MKKPSLDWDGDSLPAFDCESEVLIGGRVGRPGEPPPSGLVGENGSGTCAGSAGIGVEGLELVGDGGSGTLPGSTDTGPDEPAGPTGAGAGAGADGPDPVCDGG
ncbi:hypothetical protein AB0H32_46740, partial [Streptomyces sp. NPDC020362]